MDRSCSDDSEIEEERAGGGPRPTSGGPEQEDRGRIQADDVYPKCWRSIHLSDDGGDTPRARGLLYNFYAIGFHPICKLTS
jgi:hypothetical protein